MVLFGTVLLKTLLCESLIQEDKFVGRAGMDMPDDWFGKRLIKATH